MKSSNKLVKTSEPLPLEIIFEYTRPARQYHRKQISLFCLPIITCFQLYSGK